TQVTPESLVAADVNDASAPFQIRPEGDYLKAKQQIQLLKVERDELAQYLRAKHPKIIKLNDEITREEKLIELYKQQGVEQLTNRREAIRLQIQNLEAESKDWEVKALDSSR